MVGKNSFSYLSLRKILHRNLAWLQVRFLCFFFFLINIFPYSQENAIVFSGGAQLITVDSAAIIVVDSPPEVPKTNFQKSKSFKASASETRKKPKYAETDKKEKRSTGIAKNKTLKIPVQLNSSVPYTALLYSYSFNKSALQFTSFKKFLRQCDKSLLTIINFKKLYLSSADYYTANFRKFKIPKASIRPPPAQILCDILI